MPSVMLRQILIAGQRLAYTQSALISAALMLIFEARLFGLGHPKHSMKFIQCLSERVAAHARRTTSTTDHCTSNPLGIVDEVDCLLPRQELKALAGVKNDLSNVPQRCRQIVIT